MRARRGSALILVLLMTLAVAGLAIAAIFMSSSAGLLSRFYDREREFRLAAESGILQPCDQAGILDRDRRLIIVAIERPGLHLTLVQFSIVQQAVERVEIMVARRPDLAKFRLQLSGQEQPGGHSTISMPS